MSDANTIVDSLNHPLAFEIRKLLAGEDNNPTQIIIEDEENILQALEGKINLLQLFTEDKATLSKNLSKKLSPSVSIIEVAKRTCKKIFASTRKPHLFAIAQIPHPLPLSTLTKLKRDLVVLDGLSITGNIGAIIRTSLAFDIGGIIFLNGNLKNIYDRRVIRSSRGYLFRVPTVAATPKELIHFCQTNNIKMIVTSTHTKTLFEDIANTEQPMALIFGSEKEGHITEEILQSATLAKIPINPIVESLNVSVAASIFLYLRKFLQKQY